MTKRMREIQTEIAEKAAQAQTALSEKDMEKASALVDEVEALKKEFTLCEKVEASAKSTVPAEAEKPVANSVKAFADAARRGFKGMSEGTAADGGYTVPEDIRTRVEKYRDAKKSLRDLVTVINVTTNSGKRTFKTRAQQTGFSKVGEGAAFGKKATPQFERLAWEIEKYGGYFPITNELLADSDANIVNEVVEWAGDESRVTGNKLVLEQIASKALTNINGLDDIKYALNVTLGQAFKPTSKIITNDDGLQYLDTLKDGEGEYLLQPRANEPMMLQLCAGATVVPVEVIPNADMPSADVYEKTTDEAVVTGKTYYTRSGSGTSADPYVYTAVESPSTASIANYYEKHAGIPFIIGDLKEGIVFWDRQLMTLKQSDVAVVGSGDDYLNAFEEDLLLIRATEREDVTVKDGSAFVRGQYIKRD